MPVRSAELALSSRQDVIDFIFHRSERRPATRFGQLREILIVDVEGLATNNVYHRTPMQIIKFFCMRHDEVSLPERVFDRFPFGKWNRDYGEWAKIICENTECCGRIFLMTQPSLPVPHEQRKIEHLLIALAKKQPISAKPAPIAFGRSATGTAHPRVFFST